ncbi:hypothetical protein HDV00_007327 [Rhizophlyctis rosea]|nr:hypothetical protein HDV00_007327 [Rhizophlyctis rosea]
MYATLLPSTPSPTSPSPPPLLPLLRDGKTTATTGSIVSPLYRLKDVDNRDGAFFVFPDLSVRMEGSYRLRFTLFEVVGGEVWFCGGVESEEFHVYPAKKFPGMEESTYLSRTFAEQGLNIRIRKENRAKRIKPQPPSTPSDDDNQNPSPSIPSSRRNNTSSKKRGRRKEEGSDEDAVGSDDGAGGRRPSSGNAGAAGKGRRKKSTAGVKREEEDDFSVGGVAATTAATAIRHTPAYTAFRNAYDAPTTPTNALPSGNVCTPTTRIRRPTRPPTPTSPNPNIRYTWLGNDLPRRK